MTDKLPDHLGGHVNYTHIDIGSLEFMQKNFGIKSMMDIGCSMGWQIREGLALGIDSYGIDGAFTLTWDDDIFDRVSLFDFQDGKPDYMDETFDLGWSVEFLEHVEEKYMVNYMDLFRRCKYVVCTYAPPGFPGHHHVNCQPHEYWVDKFASYGFEYDEEVTERIRSASTMGKPFIKERGMFYKRND